jgi:hypothetical protein
VTAARVPPRAAARPLLQGCGGGNGDRFLERAKLHFKLHPRGPLIEEERSRRRVKSCERSAGDHFTRGDVGD